MSSEQRWEHWPTQRIRVPVVSIRRRDNESDSLAPLRVELVGIEKLLSEKLAQEPSLVHKLSPSQFEEFICEQLFCMGFEPRRTGHVNKKDGGIDIVFWPRLSSMFPFLGAAQVKHHQDPMRSQGSLAIRELAGVIAHHPFNVGLFVTNTSFSPDAKWFAREHGKLLRLRDFNDIRRWLMRNFSDDAEWREIPSSIEICPGVVVRIR